MMEVNSMMINKPKPKQTKPSKKRKSKKQLYCKRCGGYLKKKHLQIQLNPKRLINVCASCFEWARNKTPIEIRKDYAKRAKRKL